MGNISVKLFQIWTSGSGGDLVLWIMHNPCLRKEDRSRLITTALLELLVQVS